MPKTKARSSDGSSNSSKSDWQEFVSEWKPKLLAQNPKAYGNHRRLIKKCSALYKEHKAKMDED